MHVITSYYDHNSVQRMLNAFAAEGWIRLTRVGRKGDPIWRAEDVLKAVDPATVLVALTHASNVTGAIGDVAAVGAGLRRRAVGATRSAPARRPWLLVDAAQTAGAVPIAMEAEGIDLLAMPGHKGLLGPSGTGLLLLGASLPSLAPWRMGGTGVDSTNPSQPQALPIHLEAGTPNVFGLAGLRASLAFVEKRGIAAIGRHERSLRRRLVARLQGCRQRGWLRLHAAEPERDCVGVLSMDFGGRVPESDVAAILNADFGIAVRSGLHCAPWVHALLGTEPMGTLRVSPGVFSTAGEIDRLADALEEILTAVVKGSGQPRRPCRRNHARRASR